MSEMEAAHTNEPSTAPAVEDVPLWQPLDDATRQIRLIRLLPSGWCDDSIRSSKWAHQSPKVEIECALTVVSPEDRLYKFYNALSYAWGNLEKQGTRWIRVNGVLVELSLNLFAALEALQNALDAEYDRRVKENPAATDPIQDYVWIDHICINQQDLEEKSSQVRRMRDIYVDAGSVVAWLGPETDEARRSLALAEQVADCYDMQARWDNEYLGHDKALAILQDREDHIQDLVDLADLFDRAYFKRIWIVQEYAANRAVEFWCGRIRIAGHRLWILQGILLGFIGRKAHDYTRIKVLALKNPSTRRRIEDCVFSQGPRMLQKTRDAMFDTESYSDGWILWLLQLHRWREGSDPRDKVYALAGLFLSKEGELEFPFPIDYHRSTASVYVDIFKTQVTQAKGLRILRYLTGHKSEVEDLPSWAVDWSAHSIDHLVVMEERNHRADQPCYCGPEDATCDIVNIKITNHVMEVNGATIGKIDDASLKFLTQRSGSDRDVLREYLAWLPLVAKSSGDEMEKLLALSRTLTAGILTRSDSDWYKLKMNEVTHNMMELAKREFPEVSLTEHISQSVIESVAKKVREDEPLSTDDMKLSMWDGKIAFCAEQKAFGKVPALAEVGDTLAVFFSCPLVMVLREQADGFFRVVGTSYFDSFMDGQAMRLIKDGKLQPRTFSLR